MKALALLLLIGSLGTPAQAQEEADAEECRADPESEARAIADARQRTLARHFQTLTTETVDDALHLSDVYWDAQEGQLQARNQAYQRAAPQGTTVDWPSACRTLARPVGVNCLSLSEPRLRQVCALASVPSAGRAAGRCALALPEDQAACALALEGRAEPCDQASGEAAERCASLRELMGASERLCGAEADGPGCLASRTARALAGQLEACDVPVAWPDPHTGRLLSAACRAAASRRPEACPTYHAAIRHWVHVDLLVRMRSGVSWLVALGASNRSAMCAVEVTWEEDGVAGREVLALDLTGGGRAAGDRAHDQGGVHGLAKRRLGGDRHPHAGQLQARTACVYAVPWAE